MINPFTSYTGNSAQNMALPAVRPNIVSSSVDPEMGSQDQPQPLADPEPGPARVFNVHTFRQDPRIENEVQPSGIGTNQAARESVGDSSAFIGLLNDSVAQEAITASTVNPDISASERATSVQQILFQ